MFIDRSRSTPPSEITPRELFERRRDFIKTDFDKAFGKYGTAGIVTADAPPEFKKNAVWRCANHHVMICHIGANLPCEEKADLSMTPSPEMADFCKANPASDVVPAVVTGRATVYEWKCDKDTPVTAGQVLKVDPQGFLADFWHELPTR